MDPCDKAISLRLLRVRIATTEPGSWWCCRNGNAILREHALAAIDAALQDRGAVAHEFYESARRAQSFAEQILNYEPSMHRRADSIDWVALQFRREQMYREFYQRWQS